jgi:hypothetical protein
MDIGSTGAGGAVVATEVPHFLQNFAPAASGCAHALQVIAGATTEAIGIPHDLQNFALSLLLAPHLLQSTIRFPLYCCCNLCLRIL